MNKKIKLKKYSKLIDTQNISSKVIDEDIKNKNTENKSIKVLFNHLFRFLFEVMSNFVVLLVGALGSFIVLLTVALYFLTHAIFYIFGLILPIIVVVLIIEFI